MASNFVKLNFDIDIWLTNDLNKKNAWNQNLTEFLSRKQHRRSKVVVDLVDISVDSTFIRHFTHNRCEQKIASNAPNRNIESITEEGKQQKYFCQLQQCSFRFVWLFHSFSFYVRVAFMPYASSYCSDKNPHKFISSFYDAIKRSCWIYYINVNWYKRERTSDAAECLCSVLKSNEIPQILLDELWMDS